MHIFCLIMIIYVCIASFVLNSDRLLIILIAIPTIIFIVIAVIIDCIVKNKKGQPEN